MCALLIGGTADAAPKLAEVDVAAFKSAFNAGSDHVRVVALLSPT